MKKVKKGRVEKDEEEMTKGMSDDQKFAKDTEASDSKNKDQKS